MDTEYQVESLNKGGSERKLLISLEDEDTVAVILTRKDLDAVIASLDLSGPTLRNGRAESIWRGLRRLRDEAFPSKEGGVK